MNSPLPSRPEAQEMSPYAERLLRIAQSFALKQRSILHQIAFLRKNRGLNPQASKQIHGLKKQYEANQKGWKSAISQLKNSANKKERAVIERKMRALFAIPFYDLDEAEVGTFNEDQWVEGLMAELRARALDALYVSQRPPEKSGFEQVLDLVNNQQPNPHPFRTSRYPRRTSHEEREYGRSQRSNGGSTRRHRIQKERTKEAEKELRDFQG